MAVGLRRRTEGPDALTEYVKTCPGTLFGEHHDRVYQGLVIPEGNPRQAQAKKEIMKVEDAVKSSEANGIRLIEVTGKRGSIGAVAGIGCFDMGIAAAGLLGDFDT